MGDMPQYSSARSAESRTTELTDQRRRCQQPLPERSECAVVGAGLSGLVAAAYLAQAGWQVSVFDSHYVAGGCGTQFGRTTPVGRFRFDIGLHYIGDCGPNGRIPTILTGVGIEQRFLPLDPAGFDVLIYPGLTFPVPVGHGPFREALTAYFPQQRRAIDRYIAFLLEVEAAVRVKQSRGAWDRLRTLPQLLWRLRKLPGYHQRTLADLLDACGVSDPQLRAVVVGQHGDYGLPPSEVSCLLHAGLCNHYLAGAYYPEGGGQILADRLAERIEASGGSIHLQSTVEQIQIAQGRVGGLVVRRQDGQRHEVATDRVLSAGDYRRTLLGLVGPEHLPSGWIERAEQMQMAEALFSTYLGIEGDLGRFGMRAANYWQFDSWDVEASYRRIRGAEQPTSFGAFITSGSLKDPRNPRHAPCGHQTLEVMTITSGRAEVWAGAKQRSGTQAMDGDYRREPLYLENKQRVEAELLGRLERLFPGIGSAVVYRESSSPLTHTRYTHASDGTSYGLAATPDQFMQGRPGYRTVIPGLYLAGVSTRAGHGIVGAMESGLAASQCLLKDTAVRRA